MLAPQLRSALTFALCLGPYISKEVEALRPSYDQDAGIHLHSADALADMREHARGLEAEHAFLFEEESQAAASRANMSGKVKWSLTEKEAAAVAKLVQTINDFEDYDKEDLTWNWNGAITTENTYYLMIVWAQSSDRVALFRHLVIEHGLGSLMMARAMGHDSSDGGPTAIEVRQSYLMKTYPPENGDIDDEDSEDKHWYKWLTRLILEFAVEGEADAPLKKHLADADLTLNAMQHMHAYDHKHTGLTYPQVAYSRRTLDLMIQLGATNPINYNQAKKDWGKFNSEWTSGQIDEIQEICGILDINTGWWKRFHGDYLKQRKRVGPALPVKDLEFVSYGDPTAPHTIRTLPLKGSHFIRGRLRWESGETADVYAPVDWERKAEIEAISINLPQEDWADEGTPEVDDDATKRARQYEMWTSLMVWKDGLLAKHYEALNPHLWRAQGDELTEFIGWLWNAQKGGRLGDLSMKDFYEHMLEELPKLSVPAAYEYGPLEKPPMLVGDR
mmetsp:Transcript_9585/g.21408  ORF Transcript_9585/g.21408 Transcript_9585/m.21408 type:complete len:503 (-) Transcript_9585:314-1822(-)